MSDTPADPPVGVPADSAAAGDDGVAIRVARSGGIAGMTRRWSVQPSGGETEHWMLLVERCPWDEKPPAGTGADRFVWRIEVRIRRERHEQVIPEEHLQGPWRALVDAVQEADAGTRRA
ncbi:MULTISPECIES: protealysin inhibitor emfourin [unclassified Microbacterium]|uniref:protealysin inhibitor emfourin n=1 Tax=unclassified Microbacterium TaxID=2609290 RepID=UPI0036669C63